MFVEREMKRGRPRKMGPEKEVSGLDTGAGGGAIRFEERGKIVDLLAVQYPHEAARIS